MTDEVTPAEPTEPVVAPPEPVAPAEPAPASEPEAAPEATPKADKADGTVPKGVFLNRVQQLSSARDEAAERARAAEAKAAEYEAMIARLQAQPAADPAKPADATTTPPARQSARPPQDSFDAAVNARAEQLRLAQERDVIIAKGYAQFGRESFDETARLLQSFGCVSDDFISDVLAVDRDNAHAVLTQIAHDPDKAMALAGLSPRQRIMELTRMSTSAPKAAPAAAPSNPISRAPAPKPAVAPTAPPPTIDPWTPEGNAKMSDRDFENWFKSEGYKRHRMFA